MVIYVRNGHTLDYTNTTSNDIKYGDVVAGAAKIFVAATDIPAGAAGSLSTEGVFEFPCVQTAIPLGTEVYWSAADKKITATSTNNVKAGYCIEEKANGQTTCRVKINA